MSKMKAVLDEILNCENCNGKGVFYYGDGEEFFDFESCFCNPYDVILDQDGSVVYDNGLLIEEVSQ